jgi:nucleoside-diphosphate-sugar epimerase
VIGPRNLTGPLPIFYQRLKNHLPCIVTNSKRDFVSAADLAGLVLKACQGVGKGVYHFSSGVDLPIFELFKMVVTKMNLDLKHVNYSIQDIRKDDVRTILLNPTRTIQDFGQFTHTPLATVVSDAIDYYEKYGVSHQYTHLKIY